MKQRICFSLCFLLLLLAVDTAIARNMFVVEIKDGNTMTVSDWPNSGQVNATIRLFGVASPSLNQPFGQEAKQFLQELMPVGKRIEIDTVAREGGDTESALVQLGGHSINYLLVTKGMAWVNRQKCTAAYCRRWYIEEHRAVQAKLGVWSVGVDTQPWQWGQ